MMTETQDNNTTEHNSSQFGARLKSAREALGLEAKDAAAQLRLNERVILMMEKNNFPADMPITFIRGYLRSYGKLLQLSDHEIKQALEPIKPKATVPSLELLASQKPAVTSGNYFMQLFTYMIIFTLLSLVGIWWYSHTNSTDTQTADNSSISIPSQAAAVTMASTENTTEMPQNNAPVITPGPIQVTLPTLSAAASPAMQSAQNDVATDKMPLATANKPNETNVTSVNKAKPVATRQAQNTTPDDEEYEDDVAESQDNNHAYQQANKQQIPNYYRSSHYSENSNSNYAD